MGWKELNEDLEKGKVVGNYGGQNGVYQAVAEVQAGKDLNQHHCLRHDDEHMVKELVELLAHPRVQEKWDDVISFNPNGMLANRPTISGTYARMDLPELTLIKDGTIVNDDNSINLIKSAIEPVWNIPAIAERLKIPEPKLREALQRYTQIPAMTDETNKVFLPSIGGCTVYFFGDPRKLADPKTEVAVRCHDECNGSDVFCTDICTCRPYLLFAIQAAVECAQRGGVGLVAYFRKEGRSLGEVTKFRVYNARKNQQGGDRPETYFYQTERIAGIRDARLQELMPDVLTWLGITRIDWLLSMSSDKYNAIVDAGIDVMQRVALPDEFIPRDADVEINAKISAGYHCEKVDKISLQAVFSRLETIRERTQLVYEYVKDGQSKHFSVDSSKLEETVARVVKCLETSYGGDVSKVPYHSRARQFELSDGTDLFQQLYDTTFSHVNQLERVRRLVDLTVVSTLTDAGAGSAWSYLDKNRNEFSRSEGLAIASYDMFLDGVFSSDRALPHRCNSAALSDLTRTALEKGYQVTETNPMVGLAGRLRKLHDLSKSLEREGNDEFFGKECPRPGNLVDYLLRHVQGEVDGKKELSVNVLWRVVIHGMRECWPSRAIPGLTNGDVWQCPQIKKPGKVGSDLVPFHKLPQWLMYSLVEICERFLGLRFTDMNLMTGLAEYRNGGLFLDTGLIVVKRDQLNDITHDVGSEVIVEWRALTICLLDEVADALRAKLNVDDNQLSMAKVLQAGTWQAGRDIAKEKRPDASPPINILLDGTVF